MYNFPAEYESNTCLRNAGDQFGFESQAIVRASQLYEMARLKNFFTRLWARLLGHSSELLNMSDMNTAGKPWNASSLGNQSVPVRHIRGSESRAQDFDAHFNPAQKKNRERWLNIAQIILIGGYLPAVELVKVKDIYYVRDGHHRVSVARAVGQHYIDAIVTVLQLNERVGHVPASLTAPVSLGCLCEEQI
ncbi:MAG: hypothetical protein Q8O57_00045 [Kiritimatiellota bacterium]|nr:hypothetical protein [Kiritimatiellota bacterium]